MKIYHGSPEIVSLPELRKGKLHNDYGQGFYCTRDRNLACEWACQKPTGFGYVNEYELDESGLMVIDLDKNPHGVIGWAATLMSYRPVNYSRFADPEQVEAFVTKYASDFSGVDVVEGYRADDSYFDIMRGFVSNAISVDQLEWSLRLGGLGRQVVLKSAKAFERISLTRADRVDAHEWHPKRNSRDTKVRSAFTESIRGSHKGSSKSSPKKNGTYFNEIVSKL